VLAPGLVLAVAGADEVALEEGWLAPTYGVRVPTAVVSASLTMRDATLVTLLAPTRDDDRAPTLTVLGRGAAEVVTARGRDVVTWSSTDAAWGRAER